MVHTILRILTEIILNSASSIGGVIRGVTPAPSVEAAPLNFQIKSQNGYAPDAAHPHTYTNQ